MSVSHLNQLKPSVSVLFIYILKQKNKGWTMALETAAKEKHKPIKYIPTE